MTRESGEGYQFSETDVEVIIYVDLEQGNKGRLAYKVQFLAENAEEGMIVQPNYIVDANSKEVIRVWNGLTSVLPETFLPKQ